MKGRHWGGIALIVGIFAALLFTTVGTRNCGNVPTGITNDSAEVLVQHHDTLRSVDTLNAVPASHQTVCTGGGFSWPFLLVALVVAAAVIVWVLRDVRRNAATSAADARQGGYRACVTAGCGMNGVRTRNLTCERCGRSTVPV